jgi:hypothetical protein
MSIRNVAMVVHDQPCQDVCFCYGPPIQPENNPLNPIDGRFLQVVKAGHMRSWHVDRREH